MNDKEISVYEEEKIQSFLKDRLQGWEYDGKWIRKKFKTHSWKGTLMVINAVGHLAEAAWHHPDIIASYAFVEVKLVTHSEKGITDLDLDLAEKIDQFILWNPAKSDSKLEGTPSDQRFAYLKYD
ncbi:MAG: 4a-hydroxytetrahydrobiopterin dehydratase [Rickettsiales bacterium]|nr:4a-hydroxytetrahydrobiopterin dehydratase [Rickettsiales bacterium]